MRLYKLENHFDNWTLEEGYVIFEPGIHYFDQLVDKSDDRTGEVVNITNLYDGAYIYFDEDGIYHLVDEDPIEEACRAMFAAVNTDNINLQKMSVSLLDFALAEPITIDKDKEQEYVKTKGE